MKTANVVIGVLAGVAAGATLGVLMAPEKGSTARKQILDMGDGLTHTVKDKLDELISILKGKLEGDFKAAENIAIRVKAISDNAKKEVLNGTV